MHSSILCLCIFAVPISSGMLHFSNFLWYYIFLLITLFILVSTCAILYVSRSPSRLLQASQLERTAFTIRCPLSSLHNWNRHRSHASSSATPERLESRIRPHRPPSPVLLGVYIIVKAPMPGTLRDEMPPEQSPTHRISSGIPPYNSDGSHLMQFSQRKDTATTRNQIANPYQGPV